MISANKKLGILLSGRGSNFLAIADKIASKELKADIAVVISNRADAPGIAVARERGLHSLVIVANGRKRTEHDSEIVAALREYQVELVCLLAGVRPCLSPAHPQYSPLVAACLSRTRRAEAGA
jgi:phosphoribosylglycinamide formyltransferase-1